MTVLLRDGKEVMRGSYTEIYRYIHNTHCYSVSHAIEHEGYSLVEETRCDCCGEDITFKNGCSLGRES